MHIIRVVFALTLAVSGAPLLAQTPAAPATPPVAPQYKLTLASGDVITGKLLSENDQSVVVEHPVLGVLSVPKSALAPKDAVIDLSLPPPPPPAWSGSFAAGITGAQGNTETSNFAASFNAEHKTEDRVLNLNAAYIHNSADGDTTAANGIAAARVTWPEKDSPWGTFAGASVEIDQFLDYDQRVRVNGGRSYNFIDEPMTWLQGRAGLGLRQDVGAADDSIKFEGVIAGDYWHKLSESSKLTAGTEIYPVINDLGQFTTISRAGWETKLAEASTWVLRLGVEHRYDSDIDSGEKHSDFNYFAGLGYTF